MDVVWLYSLREWNQEGPISIFTEGAEARGWLQRRRRRRFSRGGLLSFSVRPIPSRALLRRRRRGEHPRPSGPPPTLFPSCSVSRRRAVDPRRFPAIPVRLSPSFSRRLSSTDAMCSSSDFPRGGTSHLARIPSAITKSSLAQWQAHQRADAEVTGSSPLRPKGLLFLHFPRAQRPHRSATVVACVDPPAPRWRPRGSGPRVSLPG